MNELVQELNTQIKLINNCVEQNNLLDVFDITQRLEELASKLRFEAELESLCNNEDYRKWVEELDNAGDNR